MIETIHRKALNALFDRHRRLAAAVLHRHRSLDDRCVECGCAFPCEQACLAEHNLAFF